MKTIKVTIKQTRYVAAPNDASTEEQLFQNMETHWEDYFSRVDVEFEDVHEEDPTSTH